MTQKSAVLSYFAAEAGNHARYNIFTIIKKSDAHKDLAGKQEGKKTLPRPRHEWEDNFKMDLKEIG